MVSGGLTFDWRSSATVESDFMFEGTMTATTLFTTLTLVITSTALATHGSNHLWLNRRYILDYFKCVFFVFTLCEHGIQIYSLKSQCPDKDLHSYKMHIVRTGCHIWEWSFSYNYPTVLTLGLRESCIAYTICIVQDHVIVTYSSGALI